MRHKIFINAAEKILMPDETVTEKSDKEFYCCYALHAVKTKLEEEKFFKDLFMPNNTSEQYGTWYGTWWGSAVAAASGDATFSLKERQVARSLALLFAAEIVKESK